MPFEKVLSLQELPEGSKKAVQVGETEILVVHTEEGTLHAVEAKCPHAGAPLEQGAVCHGRLVCPWHMGTFALNGDALPEGTLLEPPPLRSLQHYAAKIEGDSILVDPKALNSPSLASYNDDAPAHEQAAVGYHDKHVVTIGGGAAAAAMIVTLRQQGYSGKITMIDPLATEPTDRTNLSKMALAGKKPLESLPLWKPEEKAKLQVERMRASVDKLDGEAGTLSSALGQALEFDAALLAPGGKPKRLGVPGEELPHVFSIRHVADVEGIAAVIGDAPEGRIAVLIGDSFIAFEAASALVTRGLKVTVVCRSPQPFAKKFGEAPAQAIVGLHQANGVALQLGAEAKAITQEGVELKSGETLAADLVIVAVGVQVATDFSHGLTTEKDGGIAVDASLKAAKKLWVAGDAATVNGTRIEHWRVAQQHGRSAAFGILAALGEAAVDVVPAETGNAAAMSKHVERSEGVPFFWTAHFGKRFGYVGHADGWDELQVDGSPAEAKFLAYYVKDGVVQAALGCGQDAALATLAERLREKLTLADARGI